jgi:sulfatase modifying factor 1
MASIAGVCIDRYEARLLSRLPDGSLAPHPAHARPTAGPYFAESRAGVKPQAYISRTEAAKACSNAGKRLCSASEWFRACTGSSGTTYPYGARFEAGRCNVGRPHVLSLLHGANPLGWSYADFNDPRLNQQPGFLALTGQFEGCASEGGVHDLVGNLHEWVADRVDETLAKRLPVSSVIRRRLGRSTGNGLFMGGFFSTTDQHGPGCTFLTAAHEPGYHDYSTGYRCCAEPDEPM